MSKYFNPYVRLQAYHSFLSNNPDSDTITNAFDYGVSIDWLHHKTKIPKNILRNDMMLLFQWSIELQEVMAGSRHFFSGKGDVDFDRESSQYQEANRLYHLEKLSPKEFLSHLQHGDFDHIPIYNNDVNVDFYHLSLTDEEANALHSYFSYQSSHGKKYKKFGLSFHEKFRIKDSYRFYHPGEQGIGKDKLSLNKILGMVHIAIKEQSPLEIEFRKRDKSVVIFRFIPLKIVYDANDNLYSILSSYAGKPQLYPFNQIRSIKRSKQPCEIPDASFLDFAPKVWGNFHAEPTKVKVCFLKEANVWKKVEKDVAYRIADNPEKHLYETTHGKDKLLVYEDVVYGIDKFRTWVLAFGRSAIVLEPQSLREEIIASLQRRKEYYETNQ